MKPSITIDERGVILHVTNDAGEGIAVPLQADTIDQLARQLIVAQERLLSPEGRSLVARLLGSAFIELMKGKV